MGDANKLLGGSSDEGEETRKRKEESGQIIGEVSALTDCQLVWLWFGK
jgi:hypothetical protein